MLTNIDDVIKMVKEDLIPTAKKIIVKDDGHVPMFFIVKDNSLLPIVVPMSGDREKEITALAMEKVCRETEADFCIFICECWFITRPDGSDLEKDLPSEQPDRVEGLTFAINGRNGVHHSMLIPFDRINNKIKFRKMTEGNSSLGGRFVFTW